MDPFLIAFAALGAMVGSFVGVVAERIYTGQSFVTGRSRCNSCRRELGVLDLVPVLSWMVSRGRCRSCGSRVPASYLALEGVLAFLFALSYGFLGFSLLLAVMLAALVVLAFIVVYDIRHTIVLPEASTFLVFLSLVAAYLSSPSLASLGATLAVAGAIAFFFFLLHALSRGRAMGLGDTPVAFSLSLLVGPAALPGLLFSFWIGALFGIGILVARGRGPTMGIEVPFVPFMAIGFLLAYFTGWNPLALALF